MRSSNNLVALTGIKNLGKRLGLLVERLALPAARTPGGMLVLGALIFDVPKSAASLGGIYACRLFLNILLWGGAWALSKNSRRPVDALGSDFFQIFRGQS
jgi:hypothetical protein